MIFIDKKRYSVLLVLILLLAGFVVYSNIKPEDQSQVGDLDTSDRSDYIADNNEEDDFVDLSTWVTYRNTRYNFVITHPPEWTILERGEDGTEPYFGTLVLDNTNNNHKIRSVIIYVKENLRKPGQDIKEVLRHEDGRGLAPGYAEESFLEINDLDARRFFMQTKKGDIAGFEGEIYTGTADTSIEYDYLNQDDLFSMNAVIYSDNPEELIEVIDQVAESFRFVDSYGE